MDVRQRFLSVSIRRQIRDIDRVSQKSHGISRKAAQGRKVAEYRLYFFDAAGHIFARHDFAAPNDATAIGAGSVTGEASSDMHSGYAIWRADYELFSKETRAPRLLNSVAAATSSDLVQEVVLEMERRLRDSEWAVARSKTLLAALDELERKNAS
jgi:hypothetical protein